MEVSAFSMSSLEYNELLLLDDNLLDNPFASQGDVDLGLWLDSMLVATPPSMPTTPASSCPATPVPSTPVSISELPILHPPKFENMHPEPVTDTILSAEDQKHHVLFLFGREAVQSWSKDEYLRIKSEHPWLAEGLSLVRRRSNNTRACEASRLRKRGELAKQAAELDDLRQFKLRANAHIAQLVAQIRALGGVPPAMDAL
jgi:hypothetical protein